jgi:hypothetical protein
MVGPGVRAPGRVKSTKEWESVAPAPAPDLTEIVPATGPDAAADQQIPGNQSSA